MNDLGLLRRCEPVVRYTKGEMFFPTRVEEYVRRSDLWARKADRGIERLGRAGEIDPNTLADRQRDERERALFLRFVERPLPAAEYGRWRTTRPPFRRQGRLARVGLAPRFLDAFFTLSLLLRGRVPGGTAATADVKYHDMLLARPGHCYYGRVKRQGDYTVLQYFFFYAMNDWRSSFFGVNDHEADWEQALVYLGSDGDGELRPLWLALAAHDYSGDDLRRRWDDPRLEVVDGAHPVIYAGAGSHAGYVEPGDYVLSFQIKPLKPLVEVFGLVQRFWRDILKQGEARRLTEEVHGLITVPFVDYARGDGLSIGPGQAAEWSPFLVDETVPWVSGYKGLWGLDTEDIFDGERAPAGPMYARDGTVRRSWYDPVGWVGLDKVATPARAGEHLQSRIEELEEQARDAADLASALEAELPLRGLEVEALREGESLKEVHAVRAGELRRGEAELAKNRAVRQQLMDALAACRRYLEDLGSGYAGDPEAHLSQPRRPAPPEEGRVGWLAEFWAAVSTAVLLLGAVALIAFGGSDAIAGLVMLLITAVLVDSILRGTIVRLLLNVTIAAAVIAAGILIFEFFWQVTLVAIAAIGVLILLDNVRELRGR
jgi:hypothetical protein